MKYFTKKLLTLILVMLCVANMNITAFATEISTSPTSNGIVGDCHLTFSLTDKTNGIFIDEISITLLNIDTNVEYNYTMTSADYLFGITVSGNVKQGNYSIALSYASKEQFIVQNMDGTDISFFTADSNEHTFNWVVFDKNNNKNEMETSNGSAELQPQEEEIQGISSEESASQFITKTDNTDADSVWNNFINNVSVLETDNKYVSIMEYYDNTKENFARNYVKVNQNKTEDDYLNMTPFERFLCYSTYVEPVMATTYSDYDTYFGTIDKWNSNVVGNTYNLLKNQKATEQAEAYKTLMEWQYNYFKENGAIYNFMTGKTSIEENSNLETVSPDSANGNNGDPTDKEIQSLIEKENQSIKAEKEHGIWSDTLNLIKNNVVTIVILFILIGVAIGIMVYHKRKAIDRDE